MPGQGGAEVSVEGGLRAFAHGGPVAVPERRQVARGVRVVQQRGPQLQMCSKRFFYNNGPNQGEWELYVLFHMLFWYP